MVAARDCVSCKACEACGPWLCSSLHALGHGAEQVGLRRRHPLACGRRASEQGLEPAVRQATIQRRAHRARAKDSAKACSATERGL